MSYLFHSLLLAVLLCISSAYSPKNPYLDAASKCPGFVGLGSAQMLLQSFDAIKPSTPRSELMGIFRQAEALITVSNELDDRQKNLLEAAICNKLKEQEDTGSAIFHHEITKKFMRDHYKKIGASGFTTLLQANGLKDVRSFEIARSQVLEEKAQLSSPEARRKAHASPAGASSSTSLASGSTPSRTLADFSPSPVASHQSVTPSDLSASPRSEGSADSEEPQRYDHSNVDGLLASAAKTRGRIAHERKLAQTALRIPHRIDAAAADTSIGMAAEGSYSSSLTSPASRRTRYPKGEMLDISFEPARAAKPMLSPKIPAARRKTHDRSYKSTFPGDVPTPMRSRSTTRSPRKEHATHEIEFHLPMPAPTPPKAHPKTRHQPVPKPAWDWDADDAPHASSAPSVTPAEKAYPRDALSARFKGLQGMLEHMDHSYPDAPQARKANSKPRSRNNGRAHHRPSDLSLEAPMKPYRVDDSDSDEIESISVTFPTPRRQKSAPLGAESIPMDEIQQALRKRR